MKVLNFLRGCSSMLMGGIFALIGAVTAASGLGVFHGEFFGSTDRSPWAVLFGLTFFLVGTRIFFEGATPPEAQQTLFFQRVRALLTAATAMFFGGTFAWAGLQGDGNAPLADRLIFVVAGVLVAFGGLGYALWKEFTRDG